MMPSPEQALLIEADPLLRQWPTTRLHEAGYQVTAADSAIAAHGHARTLAPALLLLDAELPYRSGLSLLGQLKADPHTADIPVVVLATHPHLLLPARRPLAVAVVPKPCSADQLRDAVQAVQPVRSAHAAPAPGQSRPYRIA